MPIEKFQEPSHTMTCRSNPLQTLYAYEELIEYTGFVSVGGKAIDITDMAS
jgi:hypothetical protein